MRRIGTGWIMFELETSSWPINSKKLAAKLLAAVLAGIVVPVDRLDLIQTRQVENFDVTVINDLSSETLPNWTDDRLDL